MAEKKGNYVSETWSMNQRLKVITRQGVSLAGKQLCEGLKYQVRGPREGVDSRGGIVKSSLNWVRISGVVSCVREKEGEG